jgi:hypothetical protein
LKLDPDVARHALLLHQAYGEMVALTERGCEALGRLEVRSMPKPNNHQHGDPVVNAIFGIVCGAIVLAVVGAMLYALWAVRQ